MNILSPDFDESEPEAKMDRIFPQFPLFVRSIAHASWSTGMTAWTEDPTDDGHHLARQRRVASFYCDDWIQEEEPTPWIVTFIVLGEDDDFRIPLAFLALRAGNDADPTDATRGRSADNDAA